jgi:hypothetical protein
LSWSKNIAKKLPKSMVKIIIVPLKMAIKLRYTLWNQKFIWSMFQFQFSVWDADPK